jgi:hypothetical protein
MSRLNKERINIIVSRFGMRGDILLKRLQNIKEHAFRERTQLLTQYPSWNPEQDARAKSLQKLINVIERTQFQVHIIGKLLDDDWCQHNLENETQQGRDYKKMLIVELEITTKYGFGMSLFTLLESYFRIFLRAIDPAACNGATSAFANIYQSLLGSKKLRLPSNDKKAAFELLEFIRLIRNLIHNDGIYFAEDGQDRNVKYKGNSYIFYHGKRVKFVYWDLLLTLADDIRILLVKVVSHQKVSNLSQIIDPSSE